MTKSTQDEKFPFEIENIDEYVSNAAGRKNFGPFELIKACVVKNYPALVLRHRKENRTGIYVCTSRTMSRWAVVGSAVRDFRFVDDHDLTDLLESILYWAEFCGLAKVQPDIQTREEFNVSDALFRFHQWGGLSPLRSAQLVSLILAKDGKRIEEFWAVRKAELEQQVADALTQTSANNVETEAAT